MDGLANVLDTTDDIVKTIGTLPTLLAGIAAALSLIKNKGIFTVDAANKIQLLGNNLAGTKQESLNCRLQCKDTIMFLLNLQVFKHPIINPCKIANHQWRSICVA